MNEVYSKLCQDLILIDGLLNQIIAAPTYEFPLEKAQAIALLTQSMSSLTAAIKDLNALSARRPIVPTTFSED